jgi:hypothetical protein
MCGQYAYVHRVRRDEVAREIARWNDTRGVVGRGRFVVGTDHSETVVRWIDE